MSLRILKMLVCIALLTAAVSPVQAQTVRYIHTDALGSVVAETDEQGQVVERREYEPYGQQLTPTMADGPGYTGHVQDAATGLVYMQQRYYDPETGIFLSVDPVGAHDSHISSFNRYRYANNSPYASFDPDGRDAVYIEDRQRIVIPVFFEGNMATAANKAEIASKVASLRSYGSGITSFQLIEASEPGLGVNRLVLSDVYSQNYPAGEGTSGAGGSHIHINCAVGDCAGKSAHDLLHAAGVWSEGYIDNGGFGSERKFIDYREGYGKEHIMADHRGSLVTPGEAQQIRRNFTTTPMMNAQFQGVFRVDGRIDSKRLAEELGR